MLEIIIIYLTTTMKTNIILPTIPIAKRVPATDYPLPEHSIRNHNLQNELPFRQTATKLHDSRLTQGPPGEMTAIHDDYLHDSSSNEVSDTVTLKNFNNQNVLFGVINHLNQQVKRMHARIEELYNKIQNIEEQSEEKAKKKRRKAEEISKTYECPYQKCEKAYGTEVSLNLHIKLKHNGGTKTERQQLMRLRTAGQEVECKINLPPVMMESFKENSDSKLNL